MAQAAELFADRTRAAVIARLMDGRALPAGELARSAGVSASTVSAHLSRLRAAGIVTVDKHGRNRYYRLVDDRAGRAFEVLATLAPIRPVRSLRQSRIAAELRMARTCYDHLAGTFAVAITEALQHARAIVAAGGRYQLGAQASGIFGSIGVDLDVVARSRRSLAHPCLDWSERRHHLAGALGAGLLAAMTDRGWLSRHPASRAVVVTECGRSELTELLGCRLPSGNER